MVLNRIASRRRSSSSHSSERANVNQNGLPRSEVRDQMKQRTHGSAAALPRQFPFQCALADSEMLQITSTEIQISIILTGRTPPSC
jgi:hypothetical protein